MVKPLFSGLSTFTVLEGRFVEHIECRVSPFVDKDVITVDELEECFPLEFRKGFYVGIRERIHPFQAVDLPQQFLPEAPYPFSAVLMVGSRSMAREDCRQSRSHVSLPEIVQRSGRSSAIVRLPHG